MKKTFYRPKLEAGVNATPWQPCSTYTGSLIRQTSDMILLEVDNIVSGATSSIMENIGEIYGDMDSVSGQVITNTAQIGKLIVTSQAISGNVSSVEDSVTELRGDVTSVSGDVISINEDILNINGNIQNVSGDVRSVSGTVQTHSEQIGQLAVTAQAISGSVSNVEDRLVTITDNISSVSGDVRSVSATTQSHTQQIGQLTVTTQAISGSVSSVEDKVSSLTSEVNTISGDVRSVSATTQEHTEKIGQLTVNTQAISGSVSSVNDRVTTVSDSLNNANATISGHTQQIGQLVVSTQAISGSVRSVEDSVVTISDNISSISGDVVGLDSAIEGINQDIDNINKVIDIMSGDTPSIIGLIDDINELSGTVQTHEEKIGQLTVSTQSISGNVTSVSDRVTTLSNQQQTLSATTEEHTTKIGQLVVSTEALSGSVSSVNDRVTSVVDNVNSISATTQSHTEQLGQLTVSTQAISGSVSSVSDTVTSVSNSLNNTNNIVSGHTEQLGQLVVSTQAISGSVRSVEDTVSTFSGDISDINNSISGITDDIATINDDIDTLNQAIGYISGDTPSIVGLIDDVKELSGTVQTHEEKIGQLTVTAQAISGNVTSVSDRVTVLSNQQQTLSATTEEHTTKIGQLVVSTEALSGSVSSVNDRMTSVVDNVNSISASTQSHTEQIGQLTVTSQAISGSVSSVNDRVTQVSNGLDGTNSVVSGHTEQIGALELQASGFTVSIAELQNNSVNSNYLPVNGWKNKEGEFIQPTDQMLYSASASTITSPLMYFDAGQYIVSNYNAGSNYFTIELDGATVTPTSAYTVTTDTYQSCSRKVQHFTLENAGNVKLIYGDNSHDSAFYRPKLEKGNILTTYTNQIVQYNSLIDQTSQQITLEVTQQISENDAVAQFKRTGIDITNGKVEIDAENTYINGNLELHAQDDADALTLLDDDNIERATITSQKVGPLSGQSMSTNVQTWDYNGILDYGDSTNIVLGTKTFTANSKVTSGQGYGIDRVAYMVVSYTDENNQIQPQYINNPNSCTIEIKLVNTSNSTIQYTLPATQVTETGDRYWLESRTPSNNSSITITTAGTYNIVASITWANSTQTSPFAQHTRYRIWGYMQVEATTKTLIGADGLYSTNGENNYIHFSSDGFHAADTDQNKVTISTVGACANTTAEDKWTSVYGYTGPAHIAKFKTGGLKWNLAQNYANTQSVSRIANIYTENSPYVPAPSTDVILVGNEFSDSSNLWIDMAPMEFNGHIVTVRNINFPKYMNIKSTNGAKFNRLGQDETSYSESAWSTTWMYQDIIGTSINGRWVLLNYYDS